MKKRAWLLPVILWVILTGLGIWLVTSFSFYPPRFAHEANVSDDAFQLLLILSVPVFAFVIAMMIASVVSWRTKDEPTEDGPYLAGNQTVVGIWMVITVSLTILIIINPGLVGLAHMRGSTDADLVVEVSGAKWAWTVKYPEQHVIASKEMVLPVHKRIRFEVTSKDVIHSFWIPGFRIKIDAVPGKTTIATATPDRTGAFETEVGLRIQCAELCGLNHSTMMMPVRVVEDAEFNEWIEKTREEASRLPEDCPTISDQVSISAFNIAFDTKCLVVPAGKPIKVSMDNKESIPHNFSVYADPEYEKSLSTGEIFSGPAEKTFTIGPFDAGDDRFQCDLHPIPAMRGFFIVREGV